MVCEGHSLSCSNKTLAFKMTHNIILDHYNICILGTDVLYSLSNFLTKLSVIEYLHRHGIQDLELA